MKLFLFLITLLLSGLSTAQNLTYSFDGQVSNFESGKKEGGVTVSIVVGGRTVASAITASNGKYELKALLPARSNYDVVFTKSGYVSKKVNFNYSNMDMSDQTEGEDYYPVKGLDMDVFTEKPSLDFSFLDRDPVGKFVYDLKRKAAVLDAASFQRMKQKIEGMLASKPNQNSEEDAKYNAAVRLADGFYAQGKYEESLAKYKDAQIIKPTEAHPQNRIVEINTFLKAKANELAAAEAKEKQYQALITSANLLRDSKKPEEAIAKYKEALAVKSEQYPKDEIRKLEAQLISDRKAKELEDNYKQVLASADDAFKKKDWSIARAQYNEAIKIKPLENYSKDQLNKITQAQKEESETALKQKSYETAIKAGDALFIQGRFSEAKMKFSEATVIMPNEAYPKERIKACDEQLAKLAQNDKKEETVKRLFEEGQKLIDIKNYVVAKTKYKEIQSLDPTKNLAQVKLDEIDRIIEAEEKAKKLEENFKKLVAEGDAQYSSKNYPEAKEKYGAALQLKEDALTRNKYNQSVTEMSGKQAKELIEDKYNLAMQEANGLLAQNKLAEAKMKFQEAVNLDPSKTLPKEKIKEIEATLSKGTVADQVYKAAILAGDRLMKEENYLGAIKEFNKALATKPSEQEPKDKAAEAERLEKAKSTEVDAQFEKIISTASAKMDEADYDKASELLKRAKTFRPEDKRPNNMLAEIQRIKSSQQNYARKIEAAQKAEATKDYRNALSLYTEANKLLPQEQLPIKKMAELKAIIEEFMTQEGVDIEYKRAFKKGVQTMNEGKYEEALKSFEYALDMKPGDDPALAKINEIKQIQDDLAKKSQQSADQKKLFDDLIRQADGKFRERNYQDAKKTYQKALSIDYKDPYAKRQVGECMRLMGQINSAEENAEYQKILNEGDLAFEKQEWDKAKSAYNRALSVRPDDSYPTRKLQEIENILNPKIVDNAKLVPLGEKFEGDAGAALAKADMQRKNQQGTSVDDIRRGAVLKMDSLSSAQNENAKTTDKAMFDLQTKQREASQEAVLDLSASTDKVDEIRKKAIEKNDENAQFDRSENLRSQEKIVALQSADERNRASQTELLRVKSEVNKSALTEIKKTNDQMAQDVYKSQTDNGRNLKDISLNIEINNMNDDASRRETEVQIQTDKIILNGEADRREIKMNADIRETKSDVSKTIREVTLKETKDSQIAMENNLGINSIENEVEKAAAENRANDNFQANQNIKSFERVNDKIEVASIGLDQSRKEGIEQLKSNQAVLDNNARNAYNREMEKYLEIKSNVTAQEKKSIELTDKAAEETKTNSLALNDIRLTANKAQEESQRTNMEKGLNSQGDIDKTISRVRDDAAVSNDRQELKQDELNKLKQKAINQYESLANKTNVKSQDKKQEVAEVIRQQVAKKQADQISARENQLKIDEAAKTKNEGNESLSKENRQKQLASRSQLEKLNSKLDASNLQSSDKQFDNSKTLSNLKTKSANDLIERTEQNTKEKQEKQDQINDVNTTLVIIKPKNTLGQEYPEGVSEEQFSQNDDKGILKAIITRRIVVIDGHGEVYVRTQTSNGTTFSKNGEAITEYVWQRQTQSSKLKRN